MHMYTCIRDHMCTVARKIETDSPKSQDWLSDHLALLEACIFTLHNLHAHQKTYKKTTFSRFLIFNAYKLFLQEKK